MLLANGLSDKQFDEESLHEALATKLYSSLLVLGLLGQEPRPT